jgi:hypothetical protein
MDRLKGKVALISGGLADRARPRPGCSQLKALR